MNGYQLSRQWFDWCLDNPEKVTPTHTALYFFAIETCNRNDWREKFNFPTDKAKFVLGIKSYNTYIKVLTDLVDWGFIRMITKSKNQYTANIIALSSALSNFDEPNDEKEVGLSSALSKNDEPNDKKDVALSNNDEENEENIDKEVAKIMFALSKFDKALDRADILLYQNLIKHMVKQGESNDSILKLFLTKKTIKPEEEKKKPKIKIFVPPSVFEVQNYFAEKGYSIEVAKKAHEFYNVADWRDSRGNQVRNWKQKMNAVWFKDENKAITPQSKKRVIS